MNILDEVHLALLDDRSNSIDYINNIMRRLKNEIDIAYDEGYYDAQNNESVIIIKRTII